MTSSTSTDGSTTTRRSDAAAPSSPAPAEPAPSAELLEFLGEFSDERGEWLDPLDLEGAEAGDDERGDGR